jgi:valyl-tRNA synthetase
MTGGSLTFRMSEPLDTKYNPSSIEKPLYSEWEQKGWFHPTAASVQAGRPSYTIVIPPPNVTAVLHMGHGLNNTLQDVLTRWRRMQGYSALYLPGTDHAGIATQNVVERMIAKEGKTRDDLGREAFVARVWEFVGETGTTILEQLRAIGCSCDWQRTAFTLDPNLSRAVREVFVRLYEKGLIYRGHRIINWCPRCLTALSDEEAEAEETSGKLYHIRYPLAHGKTLADGRNYIVIATTRPETMLGDTAVAVHPTDERYASVVGADVELPLTHRLISIVADEYADPEFGSGAVKMTPAHDANDFAVMKRHDFPALNILTPDAHMNENVPERFHGMDRFVARKAVIKELEAAGLIDRVEDHKLSVPHCYRCHTIVEPRLSEQWFVKMKPLAEPALQAARDGKVRFTPDRWTKVYENWMENIHDWCISRQLWWGHRIPVWYCNNHDCRELIVALEDPDHCPKCGSAEIVQDPDVLDTWFSSWLWPFSTLGWPDDTADLKAFYPTSTLVTGAEILFFWVARMIMSGIEFMGEVPFSDVYLNGTVRDAQGRKMSKSLGNGIDPLEVVELYGADALRYTVIAGSGLGTDVLLNHENLEETFSPGRNFANKVWNAGRFALMNLQDAQVVPVAQVDANLELADRWILSRLSNAVTNVTRSLETFRFQEAAETVYHFFWSEVADWYLELIKPRFFEGASAQSRAAAQATLVEVLDSVLRLMHPIMPFISDTLWRKLPETTGAAREESLVIAAWPGAYAERVNADAEAQMNALMELIGSVRNLRSEYSVPPATQITISLANASAALTAALNAEERAVRRLARVGAIERTETQTAEAQRGAHAVLRSGGELFVPLADLIDTGRERERLSKELERIEGMLRGTEAKLSNEQFVGKAPEQIIAREREKAESLREQVKALREKLEALVP